MPALVDWQTQPGERTLKNSRSRKALNKEMSLQGGKIMIIKLQ
jgi:hypothetical protein